MVQKKKSVKKKKSASKNKASTDKNILDEIIRVDHAGEYGATRIYDGQIASIFREKNAAKEVKSGLECGITFRNFLDFKEKDMIESYKVDMIERQIND